MMERQQQYKNLFNLENKKRLVGDPSKQLEQADNLETDRECITNEQGSTVWEK